MKILFQASESIHRSYQRRGDHTQQAIKSWNFIFIVIITAQKSWAVYKNYCNYVVDQNLHEYVFYSKRYVDLVKFI